MPEFFFVPDRSAEEEIAWSEVTSENNGRAGDANYQEIWVRAALSRFVVVGGGGGGVVVVVVTPRISRFGLLCPVSWGFGACLRFRKSVVEKDETPYPRVQGYLSKINGRKYYQLNNECVFTSSDLTTITNYQSVISHFMFIVAGT